MSAWPGLPYCRDIVLPDLLGGGGGLIRGGGAVAVP